MTKLEEYKALQLEYTANEDKEREILKKLI